MATESPPGSSVYALERKLGTLERGHWWLARELDSGREVLCARLQLDPSERAALAATLLRTGGWPGVAPSERIEHTPGGETIVAYAALADEHARPEPPWYPLGAADVALVREKLAATLGYAHLQGVVHGGLTPQAIVIERAADGALTVRLRGLGLPPLPGREVADDLYDLGECIDALAAERVSAPTGGRERGRTRGNGMRAGAGTDHGMQNALRRT